MNVGIDSLGRNVRVRTIRRIDKAWSRRSSMTVAETIHEIRRKSVKVISKPGSPCFRALEALIFGLTGQSRLDRELF
jgi:hypothetical protein